MNELIKVDADTQTVSARDLHEALEIKERFSVWAERLVNYFGEEELTSVLKPTEVQNNGGVQLRELQDYNVSVETAKHICLMSKTEKGKQCRRYLIDLEKAWNTPEQIMARALRVAEETIANLNVRVTEMQPKSDYFDALVDKKLNTNIRDTAKELGVREKEFVNFLLEKGYVFRQGKKGSLRPYAQYCESGSGLFVLKDKQNENNGWAGQQMYITPKGKESFRLLLENAV